mgnify:CR=1 FL=1
MSHENEYTKGEFHQYVARMRFSVGVLGGDYLDKGNIIEYDGFVLKHNGKEVATDSMRGAIYAGWLAPVGSESDFEYTPQPADIEIHEANPRGSDRGSARRILTVADEERDVGDRKAIRVAARSENRGAKDLSPAAPTGVMMVDENLRPVRPARKTTRADTEGSQGQTVGTIPSARGMKIQGDEASAEGSVIGRVGVPAKQAGDITKTSGQEARRLDSTPRRRLDAPVGRAGNSVEELLGSDEAVVAGDYETEGIRGLKARVTGPEDYETEGVRGLKATTQSTSGGVRGLEARVTGSMVGNHPVTIEEDGQVLGSFRDAHAPQVGPPDERVAEIVAPEVATSVVTDVTPEAIFQAKIEMIQQFVPGFEWDMSEHWRTRVKKALEYKGSLAVLNAILALETDSVRKFILKGLYGE